MQLYVPPPQRVAMPCARRCTAEWGWVPRKQLPARLDVLIFSAAIASITHSYSGASGQHRDVFRSKYLNVLDFVFGNTGGWAGLDGRVGGWVGVSSWLAGYVPWLRQKVVSAAVASNIASGCTCAAPAQACSLEMHTFTGTSTDCLACTVFMLMLINMHLPCRRRDRGPHPPRALQRGPPAVGSSQAALAPREHDCAPARSQHLGRWRAAQLRRAGSLTSEQPAWA